MNLDVFIVTLKYTDFSQVTLCMGNQLKENESLLFFCSSYSVAEYTLFVFLFRPSPVLSCITRLLSQKCNDGFRKMKKNHRLQAIPDHTLRIKYARFCVGGLNSPSPPSLRIH